MAESTKVRLVRCPKCENLLSELPDYSVYRCGGCGAVLRAKTKDKEGYSLSEKSEDEKPKGASIKAQTSSEKEIAESSDASDAEENNVEEDSEKCMDNQDENPVSESSKSMTINGDDEPKNVIRRELEDLNSQLRNMGTLQGSGRMSDWRTREFGGVHDELRRNDFDWIGMGMESSTSNHLGEGSSKYNPGQTIGQDRAELLRKLDELKEQLSRSGGDKVVVDNTKHTVPFDRKTGPSVDSYGSTSSNGISSNPSGSDNIGSIRSRARPPPQPYFHRPADTYPYINPLEMPIQSLYPPMMNSLHYGDRFEPHRLHHPYQQQQQQQQPSHPYFSGRYRDSSHDMFDTYSQSSGGAMFHHPSCSCFRCYEKYRQISTLVPPAVASYRRFIDAPNNVAAFAPGSLNSRTTAPPPPSTHAGWLDDLNYETGGFVRGRPQRVVLTGGARRFRPVAGGAPFITCYNCFELLQLPDKVQVMSRKQQKLRCGACSAVIAFAVVNKKLVISVPPVTPEARDNNSKDTSEEVPTSRFGNSVNQIAAGFSSDDFDDSGYDFQAMDREPGLLSVGPGLNSSKPQELQTFRSLSPSASEDENSPDMLHVANKIASGSPPQAHLSNLNTAIRSENGNKSSRSDQEKVAPNKGTSTRQNSLKETSPATEMEVSFNDYSNAAVSRDSTDITREDYPSKNSKGGESFFANIIKKSFKDFGRNGHGEDRVKSTVSVNGHSIPERSVKKAEKLAGPIRSGQYWYDSRAGFWGVTGGPCMGIIPPFIEELNYEMPENCSGGNTGVFVNGRELHEKDLELLASRGLPTDRDRAYIIDISGRVLDDDTGDELDSLGRLAPTIEKVKHGFGMKPPKASSA